MTGDSPVRSFAGDSFNATALNVARIDTSRPDVGRMYDFYLDGKDNFEADRVAAGRVVERLPFIKTTARDNRRFLGRAVTAAAQAGIRQFIDIGSGLPTQENTHEVAHRVDEGIKVAYIDRSPTVVSHAKNILAQGGNQRSVFVLDGDVREPASLARLLSGFIDFTRPAAVMLVAVMHFIEPAACYRLADEYKDRMAPGSYLILSHVTSDFLSEAETEALTGGYTDANARLYPRSRDEVERFFSGLELLDPGIADVADWRAEGPHVAQRTLGWCGVGQKPR